MTMDEARRAETAVHNLRVENERLKERVSELEKKLGRSGETQRRTPDSNVLKLIEQKNVRLEEYAAELEQKHELLQEAAKELSQRNEQLSLWMTTLKLYAQIFENEASAMIGLNREGKVILFNKTAPSIVGESVKSALHKPIDTIDFGSLDPATPRLVQEALSSHKQVANLVRVFDKQVSTVVYPMGSEGEGSGVLVKITVTTDK